MIDPNAATRDSSRKQKLALLRKCDCHACQFRADLVEAGFSDALYATFERTFKKGFDPEVFRPVMEGWAKTLLEQIGDLSLALEHAGNLSTDASRLAGEIEKLFVGYLVQSAAGRAAAATAPQYRGASH